MGVKAQLRRVSRLEPKPSRVLRAMGGSIEKFEAKIQAGIDAGTYCKRDMPFVLSTLRKWASM
jgi:hypothetical protein